MMRRMLVAGFGNVLRGDDGFGVEVVRRLQQEGSTPQGTVCLEVGTGGVALAQELMTPYDRLVIVDAMTRGQTPGSVYVVRVEQVGPARSVDMHMAVPARVLELAQAMGNLPREVYLVGCEPARVDELTLELSSPVQRAIEPALRNVQALLMGPGMSEFEPEDLAAADEVLQILYWLRGEGLLADAAVTDVRRFLDLPEDALTIVLDRLVRTGLVACSAPDGPVRYALTAEGVREGGRRFADEFADMTKPGHGECGDPECDCHRTGSPADCAHRH